MDYYNVMTSYMVSKLILDFLNESTFSALIHVQSVLKNVHIFYFYYLFIF